MQTFSEAIWFGAYLVQMLALLLGVGLVCTVFLRRLGRSLDASWPSVTGPNRWVNARWKWTLMARAMRASATNDGPKRLQPDRLAQSSRPIIVPTNSFRTVRIVHGWPSQVRSSEPTAMAMATYL